MPIVCCREAVVNKLVLALKEVRSWERRETSQKIVKIQHNEMPQMKGNSLLWESEGAALTLPWGIHKGFLERMGFKAQSYTRGSCRMWGGGGWNVIAHYKPCRSFCKCRSSLTPSKQGELRSSWRRDKGGHLFSGPPSKIMESLSVTKGRLSLLHTLTIPQQTLHPPQPWSSFYWHCLLSGPNWAAFVR